MGNYDYEQFEKLCSAKGVTAYKVAKATGITTATLSNWKMGRYRPKYDKLKKIADYFEVPIEAFDSDSDIDTENKEVTIHVPSDQVAREVAEMLHENPVLLEMLYDFRDIDEAHEQRLKGYYDAIMRIERRDR